MKIDKKKLSRIVSESIKNVTSRVLKEEEEQNNVSYYRQIVLNALRDYSDNLGTEDGKIDINSEDNMTEFRAGGYFVGMSYTASTYVYCVGGGEGYNRWEEMRNEDSAGIDKAHVFVCDKDGNEVAEFDADGEFLEALDDRCDFTELNNKHCSEME